MRTPWMAPLLVVAAATTLLVTESSGAPPTGPAVGVTPADVVFDATSVGRSTARTITVKSAGTEAVTVTRISIYGTNKTDFSIGADACTSAGLAPKQSCTFDAVFSPSADGTRLAHIKLESTAACNVYVTLAGGGAARSADTRSANCTSSGSATPTPAPTATYDVPATPTPSGSDALGFGAVGGGTCSGRAKVKIHFHTGVHRRLRKGATVTFAGRTFKVHRVKKKRNRVRGYYYAKLSFSGLKGKRYKVKVRGTLDNGKPYARNRVFVSCVTAS